MSPASSTFVPSWTTLDRCHSEWIQDPLRGVFFFSFFFHSFFFLLSPRVLLVALSERGKNSFSAPRNKTRTHFSQGSQALRGLCLPVWETCVRESVQICVLALCCPRISFVLFPLSDRHTQRQTQAGGGGGRSVQSWRRQGQGRPKKWNPIRRRSLTVPFQISLTLAFTLLFGRSHTPLPTLHWDLDSLP